MPDQRRHQRIRFSVAPTIKLGYNGTIAQGLIENLSRYGLMVRSPLRLEISRQVGCEFHIVRSPLIDVAATVVSRVGDLYGLRFPAGPIASVLIDDAIQMALAEGQAAMLSVHELGGRKVMRIVGGLTGALRNDFMHALTRVGVDRLDLAGVTAVEQGGLALCLVAAGRHGVEIGDCAECFADAWKLALANPGALENIDKEWNRASQL